MTACLRLVRGAFAVVLACGCGEALLERADAAPAARILAVTGSAISVAEDGTLRETAVFGALNEAERIVLMPGCTLTVGYTESGLVENAEATDTTTTLSIADGKLTPRDGVTQLEVPEAVTPTIGQVLAAMPEVSGPQATLPRRRILAPPIRPIEGSTTASSRPAFAWPAVDAAERYEVELFHVEAEPLWSAVGEAARLAYPDEAPLAPGEHYRWEAFAVVAGERKRAARGAFTVASEAQLRALKDLAALRHPQVHALTAIAYEQVGLIEEAIGHYAQASSVDRPVTAVEAALTELLLRAGAAKLADSRLQLALAGGFEFEAAESVDAATSPEILQQRSYERVYRTLERVCWWPPALAANHAARRGGNIDEIASQLRARFTDVVRNLVDAGVSEHQASTHLLVAASLQHNWQRFDGASQLLDEATPHVLQPEIWKGAQALFFTLRGLIAAENSRFAQALSDHARALQLREELGLIVDVAESLHNRGDVLMRLGDHAAARNAFEQALKLYLDGDFDPLEYPKILEAQARSKIGLSKAFDAALIFDEAMDKLHSALKDRAGAGAADLTSMIAHNNLALVLYNLGEFKECADELTIAETAALALGVRPGDVRWAEGRANRGWLHYALGNLEQAEAHFSEALAAVSAIDAAHRRIPEFQSYLARVLADRGDVAQAARLLSDALRARQHEAAAVLSSALAQRDRLAYLQMLRVHTESTGWPGVLDTFLELAPRLNIPDAEQYAQVLAWKGILGDDRARELDAAQEDPEAAKFRSQLLAVRGEMRALSQSNAAESLIQIGVLEEEANRIERQLAERVQHRRASAPPTVKEVAAGLPDDSALVDFIEVRKYETRLPGRSLEDDRRYLAFVVDAEGQVARHEFTNPALQIDGTIRRFVETTASPQHAVQGVAIARQIAKPLQKLVGSARTLIISPDGALHRLPWGALEGVESEYWLEEVAFAIVPAAQSLARAGARPVSDRASWLVVGDVDYGMSEVNPPKWEPLPGTRHEAEDVDRRLREQFPDATNAALLTGAGATKAAVAEGLPASRFVHLATHGGFNDQLRQAFEVSTIVDQFDSYLVFAGAHQADPPALGYLTAEEVGELDLSGAELVTLSACETARGHVQAAQGLVGLVAALRAAGAESVVSALWKVPDAATAALMARFYEHLLAHPRRNVAEALRAAQLDLLRAEGEQFAHPFYWAAWTDTGAPRTSGAELSSAR